MRCSSGSTVICIDMDHQLTDMPDAILRRYARRFAGRPPAIGARICGGAGAARSRWPAFSLLPARHDRPHLLLMVRRRVAELWGSSALTADSPTGRVCYRTFSAEWVPWPSTAACWSEAFVSTSSSLIDGTATPSRARVPRSSLAGCHRRRAAGAQSPSRPRPLALARPFQRLRP